MTATETPLLLERDGPVAVIINNDAPYNWVKASSKKAA